MAGNVMSLPTGGNMSADTRKQYADAKKMNKGEIGKPPVWLSKEAKHLWKLICAHYEGLPVLTEIDRTGLATLCVAAAKMTEMDKRITAAEDIDEEKALVKLRAEYEKTYRTMSQCYGLSPKDRSALVAAMRAADIPVEDEKDPLLEALDMI